ncbi:guanylate-binding protein 6-like [Carlito syrichta]|uniref:Guanylate-binding protein 6-like n=1 Tax=Carlito syrichta TaxID=1868482 RepID=A0A1U7TUQ4_CARSF|nr:guanylate-binding protein 6-like [Carlito syrichta]
MASGPIMLVPLCLVENKNEQLCVNQKALKILYKISQPVVVVAIVGLCCTGKSYLMNRLAREKYGFPLGSTVTSETKGIWMWCMPHPSKPNHTLVLLDTEGLGNVEKSDPKNDSWIFALALLLSSTLVYNSMSTINNDSLEKLQYVTELTELIRAKSSTRPDRMEDSTEFVSFFPDFIWIVRDFTLELKLNGRLITEDEYLENALKLIPGDNPKAKNSNKIRASIRHFFPQRKCFVFDRPKYEKDFLANIEDILDNQLDLKFQEQSNNFCSYIFTHARTKTLMEEVKITGNQLGTLVVTFIDVINSEEVLCLENVMTTLDLAAVQKAADHYSQQMVQQVRFPTDTLQELLDVHVACEREAVSVFIKYSFKDGKGEFQEKLMETIKNKKEEFLLQNEKASFTFCQSKLNQISKTLMESFSSGRLYVPGGYNHYRDARKLIEWSYSQVPRKGVKANEALQHFLKSQVAIEECILQADKTLTDEQKAIAAERARKEAIKKEQELLRQEQKEQQKMEPQKGNLKENVVQLREKLKMKRDNDLGELTRILEHKLKVSPGVDSLPSYHSVLGESSLFLLESVYIRFPDQIMNSTTCVTMSFQRGTENLCKWTHGFP